MIYIAISYDIRISYSYCTSLNHYLYTPVEEWGLHWRTNMFMASSREAQSSLIVCHAELWEVWGWAGGVERRGWWQQQVSIE